MWRIIESEEPIDEAVLEKISNLLEAGVDPFAVDPKHRNYSLLMKACQKGKTEIVKKFLTPSPVLSAFEERDFLDGRKERLCARGGARESTALAFACAEGHYEIVLMLVEAGASIYSENRTHETPLYLAVSVGNEQIVSYLLKINDRGAQYLNVKAGPNGSTALHQACKREDPTLTHWLLQAGASIHVTNKQGATPLHYAAFNERAKNISALLAHPECTSKYANLTATERKRTALHEACAKGNAAIVELLVEKGASILEQDADGTTMLHAAVESGNASLVQWLLEYSGNYFDLNVDVQKKSNGQTALHLACKIGSLPMVENLVLYGANMELCGEAEIQPLHNACHYGHPLIVKFLLEHLGDSQHVIHKQLKGNGRTPLEIACEQGHDQVVQQLLEKTPKNNAVHTLKSKAFQLACTHSHFEVARVLLRMSGGDPLGFSRSLMEWLSALDPFDQNQKQTLNILFMAGSRSDFLRALVNEMNRFQRNGCGHAHAVDVWKRLHLLVSCVRGVTTFRGEEFLTLSEDLIVWMRAFDEVKDEAVRERLFQRVSAIVPLIAQHEDVFNYLKDGEFCGAKEHPIISMATLIPLELLRRVIQTPEALEGEDFLKFSEDFLCRYRIQQYVEECSRQRYKKGVDYAPLLDLLSDDRSVEETSFPEAVQAQEKVAMYVQVGKQFGYRYGCEEVMGSFFWHAEDISRAENAIRAQCKKPENLFKFFNFNTTVFREKFFKQWSAKIERAVFSKLQEDPALEEPLRPYSFLPLDGDEKTRATSPHDKMRYWD